MKPILVDALYINSGGGLSILQRLIKGLGESCVSFVLIKDIRCLKLEYEEFANTVIVMPPSLRKRHLFYKVHKHDFHFVLCFGNIPSTIKMPFTVHTYFHNLSILTPPNSYSKKRIILFYLKRQVIKFCSRNTDTWIVQTWNTENVVKEKIDAWNKPFYIFPIFKLPQIHVESEASSRNEYLFVGDYTFSKGHDVLLLAWEKLHAMGKSVILNLTVNRTPATEPFYKRMETAIKTGVPIVNHGVMPFEKVCDLYARSKAIVYPSLLESLGLGIVEGISAGCDVILLPSFSDPSPLSLVEGCCAKMPILASNRCGNHFETIEEGKNGYTFNPDNHQEVRDAFEKMLARRKEWPAMGEHSRELFNKNFKQDIVLNRFISELTKKA